MTQSAYDYTGTADNDDIILEKTDEIIPQREDNEFPQYDGDTGEYISEITGESYKIEAYANGMEGDDSIFGTEGNDWLRGHDDNDSIYGGTDGYDMLIGDSQGSDEGGDDIIVAGSKVEDTVEGAVRYTFNGDTISVLLSDGSAEIYGNGGDDRFSFNRKIFYDQRILACDSD